jgi:hypothetical protein
MKDKVLAHRIGIAHVPVVCGAAVLSGWFLTFRDKLMASYTRVQVAKKFRRFGP